MNGSVEVRMVEALERIADSLECLHEDMQDIKDAALGRENYYDDEGVRQTHDVAREIHGYVYTD